MDFTPDEIALEVARIAAAAARAGATDGVAGIRAAFVEAGLDELRGDDGPGDEAFVCAIEAAAATSACAGMALWALNVAAELGHPDAAVPLRVSVAGAQGLHVFATSEAGLVRGEAAWTRRRRSDGTPRQVAALAFEGAETGLWSGSEEEGASVPLDASATAAWTLGLGALACGVGRAATETGFTYASERRQFKRPIVDFQGPRFALADARIGTEASWLQVRAAANRGEAVPRAVDIARAAAHAAHAAADTALQVHGGVGYTRELPVEGYLRAASLLRGELEAMARANLPLPH